MQLEHVFIKQNTLREEKEKREVILLDSADVYEK